MSFDYDLIVIGTNPGGIAAAQRAASYGASVAIVKCDPVGSNCVIHGCIPETLTTYTTSLMQFFQNADEYDCASDSGQFHWSQSITIKEQHTNYLSRANREHLQKSKVKFLNSYAQFVDAYTLQINGDRVTANKILIAVGGTKVKPNLPDNQQVMTTGELSKISDRPDHVVIVGSNHVAVRAAGRINALGTKVTLITLESQLLSGYDDDLRAAVQAALSKSGVQVLCRSQVQQLERQQSCVKLTVSIDPSNSISASAVVWVEKRIPHLDRLNLEQVGVQIERDAIAIDADGRTSQPNIFAIGDCTIRPGWTPVAIASGRAFADTEFGHRPCAGSSENIPAVVSTHPEAATVGLSEAQAREQFGNAVQCYCRRLQPPVNLDGELKQTTFLKLVVDQPTDRILGVHMMGEHASKIIQMITLAIKAGMTKKRLDQIIGIHLPVSEESFSVN